jgi:RsiW-degrading membrane proteinase PrsW (M82 family)
MKMKHQIPTLVSGFFIFILCLLPGSALPEVSWAAAFSLDKWVHAALYFLWFFMYRFSGGQKPIQTVCLMLLFGGFIELFQEFVLTYRSGEWLDWCADAFGLLLGMLLVKPRMTRTTDQGSKYI